MADSDSVGRCPASATEQHHRGGASAARAWTWSAASAQPAGSTPWTASYGL